MIHQSADVSEKAKLGRNIKIWSLSKIREGTKIGDNCVIGNNVYIDHHVTIGSNVKIQNNALIYFGATIEDGVFIGPAACLTNDKFPRAINKSGKLKKASEWKAGKIIIKKGASIGAGAIIITGNKIGSYAMVGAGSVVTKSIPDHALAIGNPANIAGFVCKLGHVIKIISETNNFKNGYCNYCKDSYKIKK